MYPGKSVTDAQPQLNSGGQEQTKVVGEGQIKVRPPATVQYPSPDLASLTCPALLSPFTFTRGPKIQGVLQGRYLGKV